MKIRDVEVNFDFLDADDAERFENEAEKVVEKCNNVKTENMRYSEAVRKECDVIEEFFDNVFGTGISEKIFKGKKNLSDHINAFEDIVKLKLENQKQLENVYDRYKPNRAQRRSNAKRNRI